MWKIILASAFIALSIIRWSTSFAENAEKVVQIASSSSINTPLEKICKHFEQKTNYKCRLISAPTGHLYAHIMHGAQYDLLLSSDENYVEGLINANKATRDNRFILAIGRVVLWSPDTSTSPQDLYQTLNQDNIQIAMPNPGATPYGKAAKEILQGYNLWHRLHDHVTYGRNLQHAHKLIQNKQVTMGFVSLSQLSKTERDNKHYWEPDPNSYHPVIHEVVVLKTKKVDEATLAFVDFLQSEDSCHILNHTGYQCWSKLPVG